MAGMYDPRHIFVSPLERAKQVMEENLAKFPVGSVVQWINRTTGDRYRGLVLPQTIDYQDWSLAIKVIRRTLNPERKDAHPIGRVVSMDAKDLQRADIPTEANKTRKNTVMKEIPMLPEMGAFPGGINYQQAKERFAYETAKKQSTKRNRRKKTRRVRRH